MSIDDYIKSILPNRLKLILRGFLRKFKRFKIKLFSKRITKEHIRIELRELGLSEGDVVMVYSSLSSLGYVIGGADVVIDALLETIGETGTLVMPAFPIIGAVYDYLCTNSLFDAKTTPSRMGKITETFRERNGVFRSIHPTHSITAYGPKAEWIVKDHEKNTTPFGKGTPFYKLLELNCWLLALGVDIHVFTHYHTFEDITNNFPYKIYLKEPMIARIVSENGTEKVLMTKVHDPSIARTRIDHKEGVKVKEIMMYYFNEYKIMRKSKIGNSIVYLLKSKDLIRVLDILLKKGITIYESK